MVEQCVQFDTAFVLPKECPRKVGFVQIDDDSIQAVQSICEGKAMLGSNGRCFFEQLVKQGLEERSGAIVVGIGKS